MILPAAITPHIHSVYRNMDPGKACRITVGPNALRRRVGGRVMFVHLTSAAPGDDILRGNSGLHRV